MQFANEDTALEHCENELLKRIVGPDWNKLTPVSLKDCFLLSELDAEELAWLDGEMGTRESPQGDYLIHAGDPGDSLYLLVAGSVEVRLPETSNQAGKRIDVFEAGMSFGEMGLLDGLPRSANVVVLDDAVCRVISRLLFESLDSVRPGLKIKLLKRLSYLLSYNLRKSNDEVAAYRG